MIAFGRFMQSFARACDIKDEQGVTLKSTRAFISPLRYKNKLPFDYYKEILGNYRGLLYELDIERIQDYAERFPKSKMISEALEREVF